MIIHLNKILVLLFSIGCLAQTVGQTDFQDVNQHVLKVPKKDRKSIDRLTQFLVKPFNNEVDKVRAIYLWIGQNIGYDRLGIEEDNLSYNHNSQVVFEKRKGVCTGFSNLFTDMAFRAGILSVPVTGYTKNALTSNVNHEVPDHVWNAVKIDDLWYLLDVTWDAGLWLAQDYYDQDRKDSYFLTDPMIFLQDHMPAIPIWQLVNDPFEMSDFVAGVIPLADTSGQYLLGRNYGEIDKFLSLNTVDQRVYEYRQTYIFNPTSENGKAMAHGLLDYAGILEDSMEAKSQIEPGSIYKYEMLEEIVDLCLESGSLTSFHDWQARMCANSINGLVVEKYNLEIKKELPDSSAFIEMHKMLVTAREHLVPLEDDFLTRGMKVENDQLIRVVARKIGIDIENE